MDELIMPIAKELNISSKQVENTLKLLEDGNFNVAGTYTSRLVFTSKIA